MSKMRKIPEYLDAVEPAWLDTWHYLLDHLPKMLLILGFAFVVSLFDERLFLPIAFGLAAVYLVFILVTASSLYGSLRDYTIWLAKHQAKVIGIDMEQTIVQACRKAEIANLIPRVGSQGPFFTPKQLEPLAIEILKYPPELGAYMVTRVIPRMSSHDLHLRAGAPSTFAGDLIMTFERLDLMIPHKREKIGHFLARALLLHKSIWSAKATLRELGRSGLPNLPKEEMAIPNPGIKDYVQDILIWLVGAPLARKMN